MFHSLRFLHLNFLQIAWIEKEIHQTHEMVFLQLINVYHFEWLKQSFFIFTVSYVMKYKVSLKYLTQFWEENLIELSSFFLIDGSIKKTLTAKPRNIYTEFIIQLQVSGNWLSAEHKTNIRWRKREHKHCLCFTL